MARDKGRQLVIRAFLKGKMAKAGNYKSTGYQLFLFENLIATWTISTGAEDLITIYDAGWDTVTTRGALNAVLHAMRARGQLARVRGRTLFRGKPWPGRATVEFWDFQSDIFEE